VKFPDGVDILPAKLQELRDRIARLGIDLARVEERFVKGGGKGGSKINKTSSCVTLSYQGIRVRCQRDRRRSINRFLALRDLVDRIEVRDSPATSERLREIERIRERKRGH
jgi:protein subunit release factor B